MTARYFFYYLLLFFPNFLFAQASEVPIFNMGEVAETKFCEGILYDSGGPDSSYSPVEEETFTICPDDFSQCIQLDIETYDTEEEFDKISLFDGKGSDLTLIRIISGKGFSTLAHSENACVTIGFNSDSSVQGEGFKLRWQCSTSICPVKNEISCENPVMILSLPFQMDELSTCSAGNNVEDGPCGSDDFLAGEEYIFAYQSKGDECIALNIAGLIPSTGVSILRGCPSDNLAISTCIGQANEIDGMINIPNISLREAATYYILLAQEFNCTPFNIFIDTADDCPVIFPSAAQCANALVINGCDTELPTAITVEPAQGDPLFFQPEVNNGCWETVVERNYTWFTFEAQADGEFAFLLSNNIQSESLDIDFNIWGPFQSVEEVCSASLDSQPIRSSWADDLSYTVTGLTNINPELGTPVTATCQGSSGDGFVKPIQVRKGEIYVVLINDFNGVIFNGAVSIDFSESSEGVLETIAAAYTVSRDTSICMGMAAQLNATGGSRYEWTPREGLSCISCPNPIAMPTKTTVYTVYASSVCSTVSSMVEVEVYDGEMGAGQNTCFGKMPTAFTPDGDGVNDFFNLVLKGAVPIITDFKIYDRWGKQVYNNETPSTGWNGKYKGQRQNPAVYVYRIEYQVGNRIETRSGDVTLIH